MINVSRFFLILLFYSNSLVSAARTKVVIIGAGASGIAAGSKLIENGAFDVKILEAEQRYGGRIYNVYEDGYYKALGAEWTPANDENIVYKMLKKANAINEEWTPKSGIYAKSSGDALLYEQLMPFIEALKNVSPELCEKIKSEEDYYREVFKNIADNEFDENLGRNLPKFMNVSIHFPCDREESLSGDPKQPVRGMKTVLDVLMKAWPNRDIPENWRKVLKLGHKVTKIDWNQQKPSISVKKGNDDVKKVFEADYVIVTIPLGVLKNHHSTLFEPILTENHQKVINNLQVGIENNIYLTFEHQWWPSGHDLFIIWTKTDVQALPKADAWLSKIEGFVPVDNSPVLAVHNMELHDSSSENLPETEVVEKIMAVLKRAFEGKGWNITNPIKVDHSRWGSNPNFLGGVTYNSEKIDVTPFREPIKNDEGQIVMLFAGEATSERFAGSVHGAVESGFKAAQVLVDHENR